MGIGKSHETKVKCIASMLFLDCVLKQLGEEEIIQRYGQPQAAHSATDQSNKNSFVCLISLYRAFTKG